MQIGERWKWAVVKAQHSLEHRQPHEEQFDGYREKAMRITSVEQVELGNIMELSITGHVLKWARQSNFTGELSLSKANGWNLKNHSRVTVSRKLPDTCVKRLTPACWL